MIRFTFPVIAAVLALGLAPRPAAAEADPVTDWLKDMTYTCSVPRTPKVVVVGLDPSQTVLSPEEAEQVRVAVEKRLQETGRVTVASGSDVTRLKDLQEGTTGLSAEAAEKQISDAFTGDVVVFPVGAARLKDRASVSLQAITKASACEVTSDTLTFPIRDPGPRNVDAVMRDTVHRLFQRAPEARTVAVCPFTAAGGASTCSDRLTDRLLSALDAEAGSRERMMRQATLDIRRLGSGDTCQDARDAVTAHGSFGQEAGQSWLDLSFNRAGSILAPTGRTRIDVASLGCDPAVRPFLDAVAAAARTDDNRLTVSPAAPRFGRGDRLEVRIALKGSQNLYCWLLDSDGTGYVALPVQGQAGTLAPLAGTRRYPFDFGLGEMVAGEAFDNLFDCFSLAGDLPADLQARWLASAPSARSDAKLLGRAEVLDLLDRFRAVPGVAEATARLVVR